MTRVIITPLLLLYSPVGLFLVLIRSLLLIYVFMASAILYSVSPIKRIVLRLMCSFLGFIVTSEGRPIGSSQQPFVSNCTTLFDHMVLSLLTNCVTPHKFMLSWALSWRPLNYDESDCIDRINDVFHIQPEELPSGPHIPYLLKFNSAPFRLFNSVQPVAISVSSSFPIHMSIHPIDWRYEIFWLLFTPFVKVHVTFLEPMKKSLENDKTDELFANSVRQKIASHLNKKTIDLDKNSFSSGVVVPIADVLSQEESLNKSTVDPVIGDQIIDSIDVNIESNNCNKQHISPKDPRIEQVLAVIPDGNPGVVESLLKKMGDVDSVIALLLEQQHSEHVVKTNEDSSKTKYVSPGCHRLAAETFSRNTDERHRSFAERKAMFLENARHRYLEVHPNVKV